METAITGGSTLGLLGCILLPPIPAMTRISLQERIPLIHAQKLESSQAAWLARFVTRVAP
jgi:hypothetical protein